MPRRFPCITKTALATLLLFGCGTGTVDDSAEAADAMTSQEADAAPPNPLTHLWFVGDSILVGASPRVEELYDETHTLEFRGKVGDSIEARRPFVDEAAAANPDALVIQLGINNVGGGFINVGALQEAISDTMDTVSTVPCVVWATYLSSYPGGSYTELGQPKSELDGLSVSQKLNELIRSEAGARANVHVADFQPLVDANVADWVGGDGLHLSSEGYENLAILYRDTLANSCN